MDIALLALVFPIVWLLCLIAFLWVFFDAQKKQGTNIGCIWALVVLILGPIGLLAYLIVRNLDR